VSRLLLCTDLDRTLLPNGSELESEQARKNFDQLIKHPQVTLVYVTGRHQDETLYLAQGNFMGMNGNYSAGILEGVVHYIPQTENWIRGGT